MKKIDRAVEKALLGEKYTEFSKLREEYQKAIENIREHLKENPLLPLYEKHIGGKILVNETGQVMVAKNSLPTLKELRVRAEEVGIDISDLGRSRTKIYERLERKNEMVSQKETPISKRMGSNQEVQREIVDLSKNYTENQEDGQGESSGDFDFLDEIEEEPNNLEQADFIGEQSEEERQLISQMLSLGSRGGSISKVIDKVDLDNILESEN